MAHIPSGQPFVQLPTPTIPDDIVRLASTYPFGQFFKAYQTEKRSRTMLRGCLILIGGLGALIASVLILNSMLSLPYAIAYVIFIAGMSAFIGLARKVGLAIRASGTSVYLFQNGIIYSKDAQCTPLFWQQIARGERRDTTMYHIHTLEGRTIRLHRIKDLDELASRIQQALSWCKFCHEAVDQRILFLHHFSRNWLEKPKERKCP